MYCIYNHAVLTLFYMLERNEQLVFCRCNSPVITHAEINVDAKGVFLGEKDGYWCVCVCCCCFFFFLPIPPKVFVINELLIFCIWLSIP